MDILQKLLKLEAVYGTPSQYKSTIDQLINYYKQVAKQLTMTNQQAHSYIIVAMHMDKYAAGILILRICSLVCYMIKYS